MMTSRDLMRALISHHSGAGSTVHQSPTAEHSVCGPGAVKRAYSISLCAPLLPHESGRIKSAFSIIAGA